MPRRTRNDGSLRILMITFLWLGTMVFIMISSIQIWQMKSDPNHQDYQVDCRIRSLTWISISSMNFYGYLILATLMVKLCHEMPSVRVKRFKISCFLGFALVPFSISWNIYGNTIVKNDMSQITPNSHDSEIKCQLNQYYQTLGVMYMLMIYIQDVLAIIFMCTILNSMKRFFLIVDDIPFEQQKKLPVSQGGRGHPLMRRTFYEYRHAFDYAYYILSRGRVTRTNLQQEIRHLQNYREMLKETSLKKKLKTVTYKIDHGKLKKDENVDSMRMNLIAKDEEDVIMKKDESHKITKFNKIKDKFKSKILPKKALSSHQQIFLKFQECTICLDPFKNGDKVKIMPQCNHIFHEKCCENWLDYKFRCPNCNIAIQFDSEISQDQDENSSEQIRRRDPTSPENDQDSSDSEQGSTNSSILEEIKGDDEIDGERWHDRLDQYLGSIDSDQVQNINGRLNHRHAHGVPRSEDERQEIAIGFEQHFLDNQRILHEYRQ